MNSLKQKITTENENMQNENKLLPCFKNLPIDLKHHIINYTGIFSFYNKHYIYKISDQDKRYEMLLNLVKNSPKIYSICPKIITYFIGKRKTEETEKNIVYSFTFSLSDLNNVIMLTECVHFQQYISLQYSKPIISSVITEKNKYTYDNTQNIWI